MYCSSLFNPTLVISLGVLLLVVGLFYFYVDYKFKEHTNKLNSVASLVTTLVSEINDIKRVNNQHASSDSRPSHNIIEISESLNQSASLIEVSDDEDENGSEDDDDDESEDDDMDDSSSSDDDTCELSVSSKPSNKVVVNNSPELSLGNYISGIVVLKLDETPVDTPVDVDPSPSEVLTLHTKEEPQVVEIDSNNTEQVKNIILDDETQFHIEIDYKKMPVNKLRAFILEKNIAGDADISKMKKNELIKLIEQVEVIEEGE